jgi:hypothetical protein
MISTTWPTVTGTFAFNLIPFSETSTM